MENKRLVALIDFSESAEPLANFCADWSRAMRLNLWLMHVLSPKTPVIADAETRKEIARTKRDDAERALYELAQRFPDLKPRCLVAEGDLCQELNALASENPATLIALGLKSAGALARFFFGSKAAEVIDRAIAPVVAVPQLISRFDFETLYVSVNRHYPVNLVSFNKLLAFAGERVKRLYFFSLLDEGEDVGALETYLFELSETYRDDYLVGRFLLKKRDSLKDLDALLGEKTKELLVLQRGSRLLSDQLLRRYFINDVVAAGHVPFAVLP